MGWSAIGGDGGVGGERVVFDVSADTLAAASAVGRLGVGEVGATVGVQPIRLGRRAIVRLEIETDEIGNI